jgi:hypothetical protein
MSNTTARIKRVRRSNYSPAEGWKMLLRDAEKELEATKTRQAKLKAAIRVFKTNVESGEPFPTAPSTDN